MGSQIVRHEWATELIWNDLIFITFSIEYLYLKWILYLLCRSIFFTLLNDFTFTFYFHALEKEMATDPSVLAWRVPGTGEPVGLSSMGSHRVGHDWNDLAAVAAADPVYIQDSCLTRILSANHCSPIFGDKHSPCPHFTDEYTWTEKRSNQSVVKETNPE